MASTGDVPRHACSSDGSQDSYSFTPVGYMESCFKTKNGTPRQPSVCSFARARLKILKSVFQRPDHSLEGLQDFSHVWLIYVFHQNGSKPFTKAKVKPPRLNGEKTGVFACRSPYRPNPIGMTLARLEAIKGDTLHLSGVDIIDGTPVLDIKPFIPSYDHTPALPSPHESLATRGERTIKLNIGDSDSVEAGDSRNATEACDNAANRVAHVRDAPSRNSRQPVESIDGDSSDFLRDSNEQRTKSQNNGPDPNIYKVTGTCTEPDHAARFAAGELPADQLATKPTDGSVTPRDPPGQQSAVLSAVRKKMDRAECDSIVTERLGVPNCDSDGMRQEEGMKQGEGKGQRDCRDGLAKPPTDGDARVGAGVRVGNWVSSPPIDKLDVRFTQTAYEDVQRFVAAVAVDSPKDPFHMDFFRSPDELKEAIISILSADPRSTYRRTSCSDRLYYFPLDSVHITCWFPEGGVEVLRVQPLSWADIPAKK